MLDAMMRITSTDGWDAISLRRLAAEAGVSMGMVQHYFTTKDEMLRFAIEMMAEDTRQRIRVRVADLAEPPTPRQPRSPSRSCSAEDPTRTQRTPRPTATRARSWPLIDGLIFNIVVGQETTESAIAILRAPLDHVFG